MFKISLSQSLRLSGVSSEVDHRRQNIDDQPSHYQAEYNSKFL